MKALLYADRQVIQILDTRPFERQANGRWTFAEGRSIADSVAQRLIAHGAAKSKGGRLYPKPAPVRRSRRQLADCQRPDAER